MESENDFMINYQYMEDVGRSAWVITFPILMVTIQCVGSAVFYFKKSEFAENLFNLIKHIKFNYKYYYALFNCTDKLFRNDFAFAIALHILDACDSKYTKSSD